MVNKHGRSSAAQPQPAGQPLSKSQQSPAPLSQSASTTTSRDTKKHGDAICDNVGDSESCSKRSTKNSRGKHNKHLKQDGSKSNSKKTPTNPVKNNSESVTSNDVSSSNIVMKNKSKSTNGLFRMPVRGVDSWWVFHLCGFLAFSMAFSMLAMHLHILWQHYTRSDRMIRAQQWMSPQQTIDAQFRERVIAKYGLESYYDMYFDGTFRVNTSIYVR